MEQNYKKLLTNQYFCILSKINDMIQIKTFYFNDLRECCYVLYDESKECVIVDPGMQNSNEEGRLVKFIEENGLKPVKLLNTHGHFDHIWGSNKLRDLSGVQVFAFEDEKDVCESSKLNVSADAGRPYEARVDWYLKDGENVNPLEVLE